MVRSFLVIVIFVPSRETPAEIGLYIMQLLGKKDR